MPSWKKVITSGSSAELNSLKLTGAVNAGTDTDKFLVLDAAGNIDYRTGTQVLTDIGGQGAANIVTPVQLVVDCKANTDGYVSWYGVSDLQTGPNKGYAVWIAPVDGYLEEVIVSPESTNTTTSNLRIALNNNGTNQSTTISVAMGAAGTNKTFTFGSTNYSFSAGDRLGLYFDKLTNTADLYSVQVVFRLEN